MPTLNWIGKEAVVKHHKDVPFRLLEPVADLSCGPADSGNLMVQGDNLMLLSRRKNTSLGNLDFADKRVRYFEDRVESLPNLQRLLALGTFALADTEARHGDLLNRRAASYGQKP